ncbi:MAG TPA: cupin domain-containing protein [Acidimicrobiales bacterium]|nr:cupin domain-containing protein [Acidimicrobiales bacterium]
MAMMSPPVAEEVLSSIGERLKAARERAGYSLDDLANISGVSKAHLSRLESSERQPSVAALLGIAAALQVPVGRLLGEEVSGSDVPLALYHRGAMQREVAGLQVAACSGYPGSGALEALRMTISADRGPGLPSRHRGEEWAYVISGTVQLDYDGSKYVLPAGTCAHFDADRPHRLSSTTKTAEVVVVAARGSAGLWAGHR